MARRMLGQVDLLGLNSLGQNPGLSPIVGAAIGGGAAGVTTITLRHAGSGKAAANAELFGLLAGLATSGAMYAMKSTRHAALGGAVGALLASGIAWLEKVALGGVTITPPVAAAMGIPNIRALNGLGVPMVRNLNGLGIPTISNTPHAQGTIPGVAGNQLGGPGRSEPPVSLLGPTSPQAAHLLGIGGPSVHGLSASYGATLLGGGR